MRKTYHRPQQKEEKKFRINEQIKIPVVSLIDENGVFVGPTPIQEAIAMAKERELDLVEVNPGGTPPVVKIIDYGQFKYKKEKQAHEQKVKQKKVDIKEIRLSLRISEHDFNFRLEQAKKFLHRGDKLKIELGLRGRERQHGAKAVGIVKEFVKGLELDTELKLIKEQDLTNQGGRFSIILTNKNN